MDRTLVTDLIYLQEELTRDACHLYIHCCQNCTSYECQINKNFKYLTICSGVRALYFSVKFSRSPSGNPGRVIKFRLRPRVSQTQDRLSRAQEISVKTYHHPTHISCNGTPAAVALSLTGLTTKASVYRTEPSHNKLSNWRVGARTGSVETKLSPHTRTSAQKTRKTNI